MEAACKTYVFSEHCRKPAPTVNTMGTFITQHRKLTDTSKRGLLLVLGLSRWLHIETLRLPAVEVPGLMQLNGTGGAVL